MKRLFAAVCLGIAFLLVGCQNEPTLTVTAGDALAFEPATLSLAANTATTVTFKNNASGLQHNWVLVNGNDTVAAQVDEAAQGAPNYIPSGPEVVATSQLLSGGTQGSVAVPALQPGTYTYICTFPGHYQGGMKGVLTVQ